MIILAIDTSFDDTAAAVLRNTTILSNVLSTELAVHLQYGGIVPNLARENHKKNIDPVISLAMKRASVTWKEIDAIAITQGPGLAIALEVGIARAKELSVRHNKPLVAVNHMEGHLLSFLAEKKRKHAIDTLHENTNRENAVFPALAVLISGGHTQFVLAKEIGKYEVIGESQDDAIGECFDKVGRMLGLGYPAGKLVEQMAREGTPKKIIFPVPMRQIKDANTSYSGLKTAAMRIVDNIKAQNNGVLTKQDIADIALGFQTSAITHLIEKLEQALQLCTVRSLIVGGGVAANLEVRTQLRSVAKKHTLSLFTPGSKKLCVDNAAMIGIAGYYKALRHEFANIHDLDRKPTYRI